MATLRENFTITLPELIQRADRIADRRRSELPTIQITGSNTVQETLKELAELALIIEPRSPDFIKLDLLIGAYEREDGIQRRNALLNELCEVAFDIYVTLIASHGTTYQATSLAVIKEEAERNRVPA